MMNSISRPMAFMLAVAAIAAATMAAANSASAQQAAVEGVALAACANRAAPPSPQLAVEGNKDSAREADSNVDKPAVLAMSKEGLVRRTSASVVCAAENDSGEPAEELSSRPQACYPPAPARKVVGR
jgi:hypothetical protein